jgi:hypothetical protein
MKQLCLFKEKLTMATIQIHDLGTFNVHQLDTLEQTQIHGGGGGWDADGAGQEDTGPSVEDIMSRYADGSVSIATDDKDGGRIRFVPTGQKHPKSLYTIYLDPNAVDESVSNDTHG